MNRMNQRGAINGLLLPLVLTIFLFFGALGFGLWAFTSRQDYKVNVDKKIATAVSLAQKDTATLKDNQFAEDQKKPYKTYLSPEAYGSLSVQYPRTWSAVITEGGQGTNPIDAYFYPDFVPGGSIGASSGTSSVAFALRMQVVSTTYDQVLKTFDTAVTGGKVKVTAFKATKVPAVVGVRVDGEIITGKQGSMVILPLRDKTIEVWTEAKQFTPDFETTILPSLTFVP